MLEEGKAAYVLEIVARRYKESVMLVSALNAGIKLL